MPFYTGRVIMFKGAVPFSSEDREILLSEMLRSCQMWEVTIIILTNILRDGQKHRWNILYVNTNHGVFAKTRNKRWNKKNPERITEWNGIIKLDVIEYTFYCISYFNMRDGIQKIYIAWFVCKSFVFHSVLFSVLYFSMTEICLRNDNNVFHTMFLCF
jgi:hypothetical protein